MVGYFFFVCTIGHICLNRPSLPFRDATPGVMNKDRFEIKQHEAVQKNVTFSDKDKHVYIYILLHEPDFSTATPRVALTS